MADTIRTLAQLNQQFADNTEGVISPQDIRDLFVSLMVHGEIGSGVKAAITLAAGYQSLDLTVAGAVSRGITVDTLNKQLSGIPVNLGAEITLEVLFNGAANTTYDFAVIRNGAVVPRLSGSCRIINAAQIGLIVMSSAIDLAADDVIQAAVRPATGTPTFTLLRAALRVRRIAIE
jgi:hypothetical protein